MSLKRKSSKLILVTNNPLLKTKENLKDDCLQYCCDLKEVMTTTRDLIHTGYKLVTHPLSGSVKPGQTPYKSIILTETEELDYKSLKIIEKSIATWKQFRKNNNSSNYSKQILADYQLIDYELVKTEL